MKKRILFVTVIALVIVIVTCIGVGFYEHQQNLAEAVQEATTEQKLEELQQNLLAELSAKEGEYDDRQIVLYGTSNSEAEELAELFGAELRITNNGRFARLTLPEGTTIYDIYSNDEYRVYLEDMSIDYKASVSDIEEVEEYDEKGERLPTAPEYSVTDTDFSMQSYYNYINMKNVWNSYTGSGVTVAVIDTGIDTDHPEFAGRISEYSYNATEDKIVKDYTNESGNMDWSLIEDEQGHGTSVAGVIAASMNSGNIVGVAPNVNIIVIKAECDSSGNFARTSDLVFGLYYAIERDVQVVNMSFGSGNDAFSEPVQLAYDSDVICVAAAGNESTSILTYPAAYEHVIGVGALADGSWELADYSNYGENTDIVAPGTTYTAKMGGGYEVTNGTSLASPIVTGAIALFMQNNEYTTFDAVTEVLYESTYDLGDLGPDWYYGYGALDVYELIKGERGTITFDMLTDELENTDQTFIRGHALQNIPEPERTYAVFDGWYYDYTCTEELDYYADEFKGDLTLYAKWVNEDDGVPYTYVTLDDGTIEIRSYTGKRRYITIPEKIDGKVVSSIGDFAFSGQTRLREVTLPSGLRNIGLNAFENCSNLVTIEIPANVTTIGSSAFSGNVRLNVVAFLGNSKLRTIGDFAFASCGKLERIELPASLESINGSAFYGTTWLTRIDVQSGNKNFMSLDGVFFNSTKSTIVAYPSAHGTSYELPEGITTIGLYAFAFAELETIDLNGVKSIGGWAFGNSSLETVVIPDSVTELGNAVFSGCSYLSDVTIGRGISSIPSMSFSLCISLEHISIPNTITSIGDKGFAASSLKRVTFEDESSLVVIGTLAFTSTPIESIEIPASVVVIGDCAFKNDDYLSNVTFADGSELVSIGMTAFEKCFSLTSITLPSKLQTIGEMAFMSSGLSNTVVIPASVTEIGRGAFASCSALTAIDVEDKNTVYHDIDGVVYTLDNHELHVYPAGKVGAEYTVNNNTISLMPYSFAGCVNLTTSYLPEGLEQIAESAFYHCSSLSYMTIPDSVTQIGKYSFAECWNLSTIILNNTSKLPRLSYGAFAYSGIHNFTVPTNVSTMAQGVFEGCRNLTSVTFAENSKLESIPAYMFDGCDNLTSVTFMPGSNLTSVQAHGLEGMDKVRSLDFSNTKLTNIDNFAFRFCESLSSVTLPETVTNIGRYAFYVCKSMTELSAPAAVEHIGSYAFLGTGDMDLYFNADVLPAYADENWDYDLKGYYLGVTEVITDGDIKYAKTTGGNIAILEYTGTATTLDLTAYDFGAPITIIGGSAFEDSVIENITLPETLVTIQAEAFAYSKLKNITIPAGVTFIGREAFVNTPISSLTFAENSSLITIEQYAFELTKNLTTVTLPKSITTMGTGVFSQSSLTSVTFEEGIVLTEIPQNAFAETKLTSVSIPNSVNLVNHNAFNNVQTLISVEFGTTDELRLMSNAFYHTGLTSLHIPANVTFIGEYCFVALPNLTTLTVDEANPNYKSVDGLLLTKSGRKLISVPAGRTGTLNVPVSIEEIGFGAFEESRLSAVIFDPNSNILTFGYRSFFKAENITEITIPASVISIDYYAFAYCNSLKTVKFADGTLLKGIYEGAFCGDINLENIMIPDSIVEISDFAFYGCSKLDEIPVSETTGLKGIYDYAFAYTNIGGEYTLSEQLIDIGPYSFAGCDFTKVTVPDDNRKQLFIGLGAFEDNNKLTEITLPFIGHSYEDEEISWFGYIFGAGSYEANDTYVPDSLKKVTITEGITFVGIGGFYGIKTIEEVDVPHSVQVLYNEAFTESTFRYELTNEIKTRWYQQDNIIHGYFGIGISGSLKMWDGATYIEDAAFKRCKGLNNIIIPEGVVHIGAEAFMECENLTNISIPNGITIIERSTFEWCTSLTEIIIPEGVLSIGENAFYSNDKLKKITLPTTISKIDKYAFHACVNLYQIHNYSSISLTFGGNNNGGIALYAKEIIDKDGNHIYPFQYIDTPDGFRFVYENDTYTLIEYIGDDDIVTLPLNFNGKNYSISNFTGAKHIIIPNGFTHIYDKAFCGCSSLVSISLPNTIGYIGYGAFNECSNLSMVVFERSDIYQNTLRIAWNAFSGCSSLTSIVLPENVTTIEDSAFSGCSSLTSIIIPENVTTIGDYAFRGCTNLTEIKLPDNLITIGEMTFYECDKLDTLRIPRNVENIGGGFENIIITIDSENENFKITDGILYNSDMTVVLSNLSDSNRIISLPHGVVAIADRAFFESENLVSITIPDSVISIGQSAFNGCINLTSITIPDSVTDIGEWAFGRCSNLTKVVLGKSLKLINDYTFCYCTNLSDIMLPEGIIIIGESAFMSCESIVDIEIPDSVTSIGSNAFSSCWSLSRIDIPEYVTQIAPWTFYDCTNLSNIILPKGIISIGSSAFSGCTSLYKIHNNSSLVFCFGDSAYGGIALNAKVIVDNNTTYLSDSCFLTDDGFLFEFENDSYKLLAYTGTDESVTLPSDINGCPYELYRLRGVKNVIIPNNFSEINDMAFFGCRSLISITMPDTIERIGSYALLDCPNLMNINIPDSVKYIGYSVFDFERSKIFNNPEMYKNHLLIVDGWLLNVTTETKFIQDIKKIKNVYCHAYEGCHNLKNAVWVNCDLPPNVETLLSSNMETLFLNDITEYTPYLKNTSTVQNIVICDSVEPADLRFCKELFTYYNVTDVTIYVESLESDLRWDDNFPGWNNGNRVVYGDKWNWVKFYDDEGTLIYCEPRKNSEIIRQPAVISDDPCLEVIGWDTNGDGEVDAVPATTTVDITAVPVTEVRHDIVQHEAKSPTCTEIGWDAYEACSRCDYTTHVEKSALGHDEVKHAAKEPTCTEIGWDAYVTCSRCDYTTYVEISELGHTAGTAVTENAVSATCTANGKYDTVTYCTVCKAELSRKTTTVSATGHSFGKWTEVTAPTCTTAGSDRRDCVNCDHYETRDVAALGHDKVKHAAKAPTCTEIGWDAYVTCNRCDYTTYVEIAAIGHDYTVTVNTPTCTEKGYTTYTCHCGDTYIDNYVDAKGHDFSSDWIVDIEPTTTSEGQKSRHCSRCDEITDIIVIGKLVEIIDSTKKFTDVTDSWAKAGIDYVVSYGYMNGTGNGTTFSPTGTMSRSMIVTVLYRIAGQPSHSGNNPFTDIDTDWYYDAVLWAYENGIVTGTSATTFAPNGDVTREQMATFLYRFAKYMGYDVSKSANIKTFPDSGKVGSWAYDALAWANAEGLITGAKGSDGVTRLNPQGAATREQVATILMRFCQA